MKDEMMYMIEKLKNDILSYIDFIKKEYELDLSVHIKMNFWKYYSFITPHNIHTNTYCSFVKNNANQIISCLHQQHKVYERCKDGAFYGTCYAGVYEYVYPIRYYNKILGSINISGYRLDTNSNYSKILHFSKKYNIDYNLLLSKYHEGLSIDLPKKDFLNTIIFMLANSFELLNIYLQREYRIFETQLSDDSTLYNKIMWFLSENYNSKITLADLSAFCHCSKSQISHIFKSTSGMSINMYLNNLRIEQAKRILRLTDAPIYQVSSSVGIPDPNYFSFLFREQCGMSPKEFRINGDRKL